MSVYGQAIYAERHYFGPTCRLLSEHGQTASDSGRKNNKKSLDSNGLVT
jgi:hypothetical protein